MLYHACCANFVEDPLRGVRNGGVGDGPLDCCNHPPGSSMDTTKASGFCIILLESMQLGGNGSNLDNLCGFV